ncbi:membrane protein [Commensalibacter papalotli (ex Servin-Garciduenas et al. 2014)]|uniref:Copper resistance protein D domain-containing protein n=1 Tax=Commensalibacter papalotli (ex Servin-Garciduenas et al. 2014) TaxID=1208583 RepID=W7DTS2_9PROT|nr:membrane protein [Commensalibacter papalotli (ex Servin-Garciduenas et al. 2014)]EUK18385.1 hypothetical protein COMX_01515 [Commensalibacter papalotli (ex Servin-Garciduenas et al. 2014)]
MYDIAIARAIHILSIVIWIGGVCMVTTILLPSFQRYFPIKDRLDIFHKVEERFAWQARLVVLLAGLSGFYMVWRMAAWGRFEHVSFWWMHAMLFVWLIFMLMLFVLEPFFLEKKFKKISNESPEKAYKLVQRLHWVLLIFSCVTIIGAVIGSHGFNILS